MPERIKTLYPDFNVFHQQDHWDDHTNEIVTKRLDIPGSFRKLTGEEIDLIKAMAALFVDDARSALLDFVVKHFDAKLSTDIGETDRKPGVPPAKQLIKQGLRAVDRLARATYQQPFTALSAEQQTALLVALEQGTADLRTDEGGVVPPQDFFKKMLAETVSAYYSHPQVWSEIGYAGPAYPRGYVRLEVGLTDPWEARGGTKRDA